MPEDRRRAGRDNANAALADLLNSIGAYPSATDLAAIDVPVVCSYGARSPSNMFRLTRSLAAAVPTARLHEIEGAGHAAPFDATTNFVQLIADTIAAADRGAAAAREVIDHESPEAQPKPAPRWPSECADHRLLRPPPAVAGWPPAARLRRSLHT